LTTLRIASWNVENLAPLRIAVFNVYAVNGTSKPWWNHETGCFEGDRHGFKRRFIARLGEAAAAIQAGGVDLTLIGEWNVSRARLDTWPRLRTEEPHATARRTFNADFIGALSLVDAFRHLHPHARKYTWFNRRARNHLDAARVDFALVSASILPRIVEAGIDESPAARGASDHAPLWLTLET
jgi:exodeoxyribonuclease-3